MSSPTVPPVVLPFCTSPPRSELRSSLVGQHAKSSEAVDTIAPNIFWLFGGVIKRVSLFPFFRGCCIFVGISRRMICTFYGGGFSIFVKGVIL